MKHFCSCDEIETQTPDNPEFVEVETFEDTHMPHEHALVVSRCAECLRIVNYERSHTGVSGKEKNDL